MKNIYTIILFLALAVFNLIGCSPRDRSKNTYIVRTVQDEDSLLVSSLLTENDFSSDWHWYSIMTKQEAITPTQENNNLVERAVVNFTGYYQNKNMHISIWQTAERYKTSSQNNIDPNKIELGVEKSRIVSTFYPDIDRGDITKCVYLNTSIKCVLLKSQDDILFTLEFSIPLELGEEQMRIWLTNYAKNLSIPK